MSKNYNEELAKLGKAVREDRETDAGNIAFGLLADFLHMQAQTVALLEKTVDLLDSIDTNTM